MKKTLAAGMALALAAAASGCTSKAERIAAYMAYLQAHEKTVQAKQEAPPLVHLKVDPESGKFEELTINQQQQYEQPQQIKDDESLKLWVSMLGSGVQAASQLGSSWISSYYGYKNNQVMWSALGKNGLGGGIEVGGNAVISGSSNRADIAGHGGSSNYLSDFMNTPSVPGGESSLATGGGGIVNEAAPEAPTAE